MKQSVKHYILGASSMLIALIVCACSLGVILLKAGFAPVNADAAPSALESKVLTSALHASVSRQVSRQEWIPNERSDEDLLLGGQIYESLCAQCHSHADGRKVSLGAAFYPPAPNLVVHTTSYSDSELFWIIKHGVRNTAMPAWATMLSDEDIGNVVSFLTRMNSIPASVQTKLQQRDE